MGRVCLGGDGVVAAGADIDDLADDHPRATSNGERARVGAHCGLRERAGDRGEGIDAVGAIGSIGAVRAGGADRSGGADASAIAGRGWRGVSGVTEVGQNDVGRVCLGGDRVVATGRHEDDLADEHP